MLVVDLDEKGELGGSLEWCHFKLCHKVFFVAAHLDEEVFDFLVDDLLLCLYAEKLVLVLVLLANLHSEGGMG